MPQHPPARSPAERGHDAWLRANRPDLAEPFAAELPGARAAVLARLWGAIAREPLPDRIGIAPENQELAVRFRRTTVCGPADAAAPFAGGSVAGPGLTVGGERHPAALAAALWPDRPAFAAELDNSVANLALARAAARAAAQPGTRHGLADAEQSVVDGHPLHPCCRTRAGMTVADVLAYAPEHRPIVDLRGVAVPPRTGGTARTPPRLLMHPWQASALRDRAPVARRHRRAAPARPLMSLRTLAPRTGPRQDRGRRADDQRGPHRLPGRRAQRPGAVGAAARPAPPTCR